MLAARRTGSCKRRFAAFLYCSTILLYGFQVESSAISEASSFNPSSKVGLLQPDKPLTSIASLSAHHSNNAPTPIPTALTDQAIDSYLDLIKIPEMEPHENIPQQQDQYKNQKTEKAASRIESAQEEKENNTPLYVNVQDRKYYGGLKLYHHSLLSSQVCRLLNPCLTENGTVLLPRWMRRHDDILSSQCNLGNIEFTLEDTSPPPAKFLPIDLFGIETPRHHMPHFLRDFIPNLISLDTAYGDRSLTKTCHTRKGKDCDDFPISDTSIRPNIFLHPRVKLLGQSSWVHQFVKLLPPFAPPEATTKPGPTILYMSDVFTTNRENSAEPVCFRSAYLAKPAPAGTLVDVELLNSHPLFRSNNIQKRKRVTNINNNEPSDKPCTLNLTILGRKNDGNVPTYAQGRQIANIEELTVAFQHVTDKISNLSFKVTPSYFEEKTIQEQISIMQKTDVLVAAHGAGITNILFMKSHSSLVELQPFEYYPDTFEEMARNIADIGYDVSIAEPDVDSFESCIGHYSKVGDAKYERLQKYLKKFKVAAQRYRAAGNTHALQLHRLDNQSDFHLRVCGRAQRLKVNVKEVVEQIIHLATQQCNAL